MNWKFRHAPTTLENINLEKGCGFILKRLDELIVASRKAVYVDTPYQNIAICSDGTFNYGYHSLLWSFLRNYGYIEVYEGKIYNTRRRAFRSYVPCTAVAGNPPVYRLTSKGKSLLERISK